MCEHMCMCVRVHVCAHVCMCDACMCVCAHTCVCLCARVHTHVHARACTHVCSCVCTCAHACVCTCSHMCVLVCACARVHTCVCVHACMCMRVHACVCVCTCVRACGRIRCRAPRKTDRQTPGPQPRLHQHSAPLSAGLKPLLDIGARAFILSCQPRAAHPAACTANRSDLF